MTSAILVLLESSFFSTLPTEPQPYANSSTNLVPPSILPHVVALWRTQSSILHGIFYADRKHR